MGDKSARRGNRTARPAACRTSVRESVWRQSPHRPPAARKPLATDETSSGGDGRKTMILTGEEIRKHLGDEYRHRSVRRKSAESEQLQPDAARRDHDLRRSRARHAAAEPDPADHDSRTKDLVLRPESALPGTNGRADRDAQSGADDRGAFVGRTAGAVRARDGRFRRRGLLRLSGRWRCSPSNRCGSIPGVRICQIFYHTLVGDVTEYASDKYQHNRDIQPSLLYQELNPNARGRSAIALQFGSS